MKETVAKVAISNHATTIIQASTSRPSVTLSRLVSRTPEPASGPRARDLAVLQYHLSVYEHVLDADRRLMRLLERRAVDHGDRIEHGEVGVEPRLHEAAIGQADPLRGERRHLAHRELERHELFVTHVT